MLFTFKICKIVLEPSYSIIKMFVGIDIFLLYFYENIFSICSLLETVLFSEYGRVLWFHIGRTSVHPSVVRPSVHIFVSGR